MIDQSGNTNLNRPFPGHEALFQQTLLISKIRLTGMLKKCISMTDKMLYDICQDDQSVIGSPNIENFKYLRSATNVIELSYAKSIELRFAQFQKLIDPNSKTTIDDLAMVCSNCHRMLHRSIDTLSVESLRRLIAG